MRHLGANTELKLFLTHTEQEKGCAEIPMPPKNF